MLDSSPVALPPVPRPLKRSASVASLPTPPRTRHKGKGVRADAKYDTDTDGGSSASENEADDDDDELVLKPKKQRTSLKAAADDDEEAFWMDSGSKAKSDTELELDSTKSQKAKASSSKSASQPAPLLYRRSTSSTGIAPVSPPPSNRRKAAATATLNFPVTPKAKKPLFSSSSPTTPRPLRDSPDNPFLVTPGENKSHDSTPPLPRTPKKERPTVTYVFRGVRGTFPNPLYDHKNDKPLSPSHNSELPVEHPDFSPSSHCVPKLLFPEARKLRPRKNREGPSSPSPKPRRDTLSQELDRALERERARNLTVKKGRRERERGRSASWSDDEDDVAAKGEDAKLVPMKLNFAAEIKESKDGKKT